MICSAATNRKAAPARAATQVQTAATGAGSCSMGRDRAPGAPSHARLATGPIVNACS